MSLLAIPHELLLQIMKHLRDSQDVQTLQSVARTCRELREVAEMYLYSTAEFTRLSSLYRFLGAATRADKPNRKGYLRDLKLLYSSNHYDPYYNPPYPPDLTLFPNLESFVSESPECKHQSIKGTYWDFFKESYTQAFTQASLLNKSLETPRPLQNLKSLTLHWTESGTRFREIAPTCPIFLLPRLQSLEISCARIGQKKPADWEAEKLQDFQHKTMLRSLIFTECVVSPKALHAILSLPKALQSLAVCEIFYHHGVMGDSSAIKDTDAFNDAINQQAQSLESLRIYHRFNQYSRDEKTLVLSLSNFPALSNLQLGPFRGTLFKYTLNTPVPPALNFLRLDKYGISRLERGRSCMLLSGLSVEELLANSETSGRPFTLDISLQHLPRLLGRPLFNRNDVRPKIRKLINELGERFQKLQNASRPRLEANPESSPDCKAYSRLRILTNKSQHKIPPHLHNEALPRFVVRYDSSHPGRFLDNPYTANPLPPDRDFSSDDEDMDIAFRDTNNSDLDMH
ncbi:hypothetical protein F5Y00DRAFT_202499 [Daldinia vernicosa]|uniref:uncharacterized protein n=1 Tax=Daldinia vernicosa TaxID=114800 RepID=UPI0020085D6E|nr:uncharacterized protein F5Y00DRAFT_202499 [Daldinia vernicosa]KAI0844255.1 hypothetical protein F5Y00DRAFT_202499 [Daldinia vernicosa]